MTKFKLQRAQELPRTQREDGKQDGWSRHAQVASQAKAVPGEYGPDAERQDVGRDEQEFRTAQQQVKKKTRPEPGAKRTRSSTSTSLTRQSSCSVAAHQRRGSASRKISSACSRDISRDKMASGETKRVTGHREGLRQFHTCFFNTPIWRCCSVLVRAHCSTKKGSRAFDSLQTAASVCCPPRSGDPFTCSFVGSQITERWSGQFEHVFNTPISDSCPLTSCPVLGAHSSSSVCFPPQSGCPPVHSLFVGMKNQFRPHSEIQEREQGRRLQAQSCWGHSISVRILSQRRILADRSWCGDSLELQLGVC